MGLLADRLASSVRFNAAEWLARDDEDAPNTPAGVRIDRDGAMSIPTVWRCWSLISHYASAAPPRVYLEAGGKRHRQYTLPSWLETPDQSDETVTTADYFRALTLSLLADGNYFSVAFPSVDDPVILRPQDPRRVVVRPGPLYDLVDETGRVVSTWGPDQMIHGWWMRFPGEPRGVSPLERLRRSLGGALAADQYASAYFGSGASLSFGVEVPGVADVDELRKTLKRKYAGLDNSHAIGVLQRGAKFVTGLAPTPEQSQMLATRKWGVEEVARIYGVPPGMAGSQEPGASSYASAVEWRKMFRDDALRTYTGNLELGHQRLLRSLLPPGLDGTGARMVLEFDLDWVARAEPKERAETWEVLVRSGQRTPDEARGDDGLDPMPGGDRLYMQQQMVPITEAGKTKATEPIGQQEAKTAPKPEVPKP
jgi:HK97 family phage portal protein